ncbi:MAG: transposase, partial [Rubrivivax sp.]
PGTLLAMEASSDAHHWARSLREMGLDARLIAAHFTAAYRLQGATGKNDANDAGVGDFGVFRNAPQFAAWLGLAPRQHSSGGVSRPGRITKRGDAYLRTLLIQGAKSAVLSAHKRQGAISRWAVQLRARVGWKKAVVAMANKNARIVWALLRRSGRFEPDHPPRGHLLQPSLF